VQGLAREAQIRAQRRQAIATERQSWDGRRSGANKQIADFEERIAEAREEQMELAEAPELFLERRRALINEIDQAEEGRKLAKLAKNVTVKVPLTPDGLKTCKVLTSEGTMVNVTLCFSAAQALLAAKAGATFVSPFVGRLDDIGQDGMHLIAEIMTIYRQYPHFKTEVLVASIRHTQHVIAAAKLGAHVGTLPPNVLRQLFKHTLTDNGLKAFLDDWAKTGQSIL
jgi:transaldolase